MSSRASILAAAFVALAFAAGCRQSASQSPVQSPFTAEERPAVDFAQAFLANNGTDWGEPSQVRLAQVEYVPGWKGEGYYEVTYPTPADEIKILGDRAVVVEIKSGKVAFVPRC